MKKFMMTLFALLTIAVSANAMSYEQARNEALFLTDKMAYELNLTEAQYEAAYEINLDYLMGVTSQYDVFGPYWERRNLDLSYTFKMRGVKSMTIGATVYNLFNEEYENNGYAGSGFYYDNGEKVRYNYAGYAAQAGTNFLAHISLNF